jgi:hypothetical protein
MSARMRQNARDTRVITVVIVICDVSEYRVISDRWAACEGLRLPFNSISSTSHVLLEDFMTNDPRHAKTMSNLMSADTRVSLNTVTFSLCSFELRAVA